MGMSDAAAAVPHDGRQVRVEKAAALRAEGWEYAALPAWPRTHSAAEAREQFAGLRPGEAAAAPGVSVAGRVRTCRWFGKLGFVSLEDASGRLQLQLARDTLRGGADGADAAAGAARSVAHAKRLLDVGDIVCARGDTMRKTQRGEVSLVASECQLLCKALRPLPEKFHGLRDVEARYRRRPLDFLTNAAARRTVEQRAAAMAATRRYLEAEGFLEVETPLLHASAGGASARPFQTRHNALDCTFSLRIAPELHLKQMLVGGFEKVFELGRVLRNEGLSPRHNPEFTSLEVYEAYTDYRRMVDLLEGIVGAAATAVRGTTRLSYDGRPLDLTPPWRRATMASLVQERTGLDFSGFADAESAMAAAGAVLGWGDTPPAAAAAAAPATVGGVMALVFEEAVEETLWQPTIVTEYPQEVSPLARRHRDPAVRCSVEGGLVERFEAFAAGHELANAFSELADPEEQRARFEQQAERKARGDGEAHGVDEDYLAELEQGMPPAGGLGIGMDRLVMLLTDHTSIREVIAFPTLRPAKN